MSLFASALADISIRPDFHGLPVQVHDGLIHLTNNLAAVLLLVGGLAIVLSITGWVVGHQINSHQLIERSKSGLMLAISSGAILYLGVAFANYAAGLFR